MSKINELLNFIERKVSEVSEESREPLDSLLYQVIVDTLAEMVDNYKDDFTEQVVLNLLVAGDDEGYSLKELEEYVSEIKK